MILAIKFCDKAHGDSDNIFKGIADALFDNDKYVIGGFDYEYATEGSVDVLITIGAADEIFLASENKRDPPDG